MRPKRLRSSITRRRARVVHAKRGALSAVALTDQEVALLLGPAPRKTNNAER